MPQIIEAVLRAKGGPTQYSYCVPNKVSVLVHTNGQVLRVPVYAGGHGSRAATY